MARAARQDSKQPPERSTIRVDGTFDIETASWDTFICCGLYIPGQKTKVWSWHREEEAARALFSLEGTFWAHSGGTFDFLWLLRWAERFDLRWRVSLSGSAVAALHVGKVTFRDSYRLVPLSLHKASEIGGVRKATGAVDFDEVSRDMPRALFFRLVEYMIQDCKALYAMLDAVATLAERWDLDLKNTIGASAWATVRRQGAPAADWGRGPFVTEDYRDARRAYYGGRTQVFRPRSDYGFRYDIRSAYPAALSQITLPIGERTRLHDDQASRAFASGASGVFRAHVVVARSMCPPLPVRARSRIGFPVGGFEGWWTGLELQAALAHGATIGSIPEALVWSERAMVLAPFCRHVWKLRDQAGPKTAVGSWLKLYANSLTGKTATRPTKERISRNPLAPIFCPADLDCRGVLCGLRCCEHSCTRACGRKTAIVPGFPIFSVVTEGLSECSQVHWSAYLTAKCRTTLRHFMEDGEDAVYCDTDSLFCERERHNGIGPNLGDFAFEGMYIDGDFRAPKTYAYGTEEGEAKGASKGIPDAVRNFHLLADGVRLDRGVNTFKTALRKGDFFQRRDLTRVVRPDGIHYGDRFLGADGRTRAPVAKRVDEHFYEFEADHGA
jgi:hypothetical protein